MPVIIKNFSKSYGYQTVNKLINLEIYENGIIGILGVNGAGKSTLMKSISGAITSDLGSIEIDGISIKKNPKEYKKKIGFLAENNPLYPDMYVREYLNFIANIYKVSYEEIQFIIEKTGLKEESKKKILHLSQGYKQRVGIAQAILHNPSYLILDEPTSGLDPNQTLEIRKLVLELAKDKIVLFSTHILQEAEVMCNRLIIIHQGKIIKDFFVKELKKQCKNLEQVFYYYTSFK